MDIENLSVGDKLMNDYNWDHPIDIYTITKVNKSTYSFEPPIIKNGKPINKITRESNKLNPNSKTCVLTIPVGQRYIIQLRLYDEKVVKERDAEIEERKLSKLKAERRKKIEGLATYFIRNKIDKDILEESVKLYLSNTHEEGRLGGYYWRMK